MQKAYNTLDIVANVIVLYIFMYITMCLYITITILLGVFSIYLFIKHYTIVILS